MNKLLNGFKQPLHHLFYRPTPILDSKISIKLNNGLLLESLVVWLYEKEQHSISIYTDLLSGYFVAPKLYEEVSIREVLSEQFKYTPIRFKERGNCLQIY